MAYTPPAFNQVNVDLYKSGGVSVPAFNQVNVDLAFDNGSTPPPVTVLLSLLDDGDVFPLDISNSIRTVEVPFIDSQEAVYSISHEIINAIDATFVSDGVVYGISIANLNLEYTIPLVDNSVVYDIALSDAVTGNQNFMFLLF